MWYIIKTNFYKEREAIEEFRKNIPYIQGTYLPVYRKKLEAKEGDRHRYRFCPTIDGIIFINLKKDAEEQLMRDHLTDQGYFYGGAKNERFASNAHLFNFSSSPLSLGELLAMARISSEDISRFRIYNEQLAESIEAFKIVDVNYHQMEQENDTVVFTDGPYKNFQGIIKQVKHHGEKDRHFFFRLGNWCFSAKGARKYNYVVVREASKGVKALVTNSYRYIDQVVGKLQATYFPDRAGDALRTLLFHLNHHQSLEACKELLLQAAPSQSDATQRMQFALLGSFLNQIDSETASALISLSRYYQSVDDSVRRGLEADVADIQLRPFLTPSSGVELPKGSAYALLAHGQFLEVVLKLNLKQLFVSEKTYKPLSIVYQRIGTYKKGKKAGLPYDPKVVKLTDKDYVYYAHIAFFQPSGKDTVKAFINWSGLVEDYLQMEPADRAQFLSNLAERGYDRMQALLSSDSPLSIYRESSAFAGFSIDIPGVSLDRLTRLLEANQKQKSIPFSMFRVFHPVVRLLRLSVPAAVEMWQKQRFLDKRRLLQKYVLLHHQPVTDEQ